MVQSCLSPIYWNIKLASLKRKVYGDELTMYILVQQNNITLACDPMLGQRRSNIGSTLGRCLVFAR